MARGGKVRFETQRENVMEQTESQAGRMGVNRNWETPITRALLCPWSILRAQEISTECCQVTAGITEHPLCTRQGGKHLSSDQRFSKEVQSQQHYLGT